MLMVDLMIILFQLELDKFYCIGAINQLKIICYDFLNNFIPKIRFFYFNNFMIRITFCLYENELLFF